MQILWQFYENTQNNIYSRISNLHYYSNRSGPIEPLLMYYMLYAVGGIGGGAAAVNNDAKSGRVPAASQAAIP